MLTSYNLPTRELLFRLAVNPRVEAPPGALPMRTAMVRHNTESTYVVPGDWPAVDGTGWFHDGAAPAGGSDVEYLIDGPVTFATMLEAMRTAKTSSHFIVLLGWSLNVHTIMTGDAEPLPLSFLEVVQERAALGVPVRVLLWENTEMLSWVDENNKALPEGSPPLRLNQVAKLALEKLRTGKQLDVYCNLDDHTKGWVSGPVAGAAGKPGVHSYGSHHHKVLLVYGSDGLVGFCGGIDIDPNRLPGSAPYLHDVQARVQGHAAEALWKIAEKRWTESQDNGSPPSPATISVLAPASFPRPRQTPYLASVVQTVGNPAVAKGVSNTLWPSLQEAIGRATGFIYIEDQYFWSLDLVDALVQAAKRVRHITILVPGALVGEHPYKRHAAIRELVKRGGPGIKEKIAIFESVAPAHHNYVHAKLFVMDDEYAMVSTANANNRGYFFDSEAAVCVAERAARSVDGTRGGEWSIIEGNFARRLRIELWAEHLGLPPEELFDGVGAHVHWRMLMANLPMDHSLLQHARVRPYRASNLRKQRRLELHQEKSDWAREGNPVFWPEQRELGPEDNWKPEDEQLWWTAPLDEWMPSTPSVDPVVDPKE